MAALHRLSGFLQLSNTRPWFAAQGPVDICHTRRIAACSASSRGNCRTRVPACTGAGRSSHNRLGRFAVRWIVFPLPRRRSQAFQLDLSRSQAIMAKIMIG